MNAPAQSLAAPVILPVIVVHQKKKKKKGLKEEEVALTDYLSVSAADTRAEKVREGESLMVAINPRPQGVPQQR